MPVAFPFRIHTQPLSEKAAIRLLSKITGATKKGRPVSGAARFYLSCQSALLQRFFIALAGPDTNSTRK